MDVQRENQLYAQIPRHERERLRSCSHLVTVKTKEELGSPGSPVQAMYFPLTAAISVLHMDLVSGRTVEAAVIGHEGCTASYVIDGLTTSPCETLVQVGGTAYRMAVKDLSAMLPELPIFQRMVRRFSAVIFHHTVLSLGCTQFHSVEQRLGRWLLAHHHRTGLKRLPFTHDFLAQQLGIQRVTVTNALTALQSQHVLTYGYGKVDLNNLPALMKLSCECFSMAKHAIDNYLAEITHYSRIRSLRPASRRPS